MRSPPALRRVLPSPCTPSGFAGLSDGGRKKIPGPLFALLPLLCLLDLSTGSFMSFVGLLILGIVLELLIPRCAKAAPGMGAAPSALPAVTTTSVWSRTGAAPGFFRAAERSTLEWARPELRRFQAGAVVPVRFVRGTRPAADTLSLHPLAKGVLPSSSFLQRAWDRVSTMRPDVTLQSVPGHGGMRIMLAVDTLSLFRR